MSTRAEQQAVVPVMQLGLRVDREANAALEDNVMYFKRVLLRVKEAPWIPISQLFPEIGEIKTGLLRRSLPA